MQSIKMYEAIDAWYNNIKDSRQSINTAISYKSDAIIAIKEWGATKITKINWFSLLPKENIAQWLIKSRKSNKASTINRKISALKNMSKFFKQKYGVHNIYIEGIKLNRTKNRLLPRTIEPSALKFFDVLEEQSKQSWFINQMFLFANLLYGLGLRISEALSLNSFSLIGQNLTVSGKGSKKRIIPLPNKLLLMIKNHTEKCPFITTATLQNKNAIPFFYCKDGAILERRKASYELGKLFKPSNGEMISPHKFRHSCASHLLSNGANLRTIQELLGHKQLSSTQIYTHISKSDMKNEYYKAHPKIC